MDGVSAGLQYGHYVKAQAVEPEDRRLLTRGGEPGGACEVDGYGEPGFTMTAFDGDAGGMPRHDCLGRDSRAQLPAAVFVAALGESPATGVARSHYRERTAESERGERLELRGADREAKVDAQLACISDLDDGVWIRVPTGIEAGRGQGHASA